MSRADLYRDHCSALQLDHKEVARLFGTNSRTSYRWHGGEAHVPDYVMIVLAFMRRDHLSVDDVRDLLQADLTSR